MPQWTWTYEVFLVKVSPMLAVSSHICVHISTFISLFTFKYLEYLRWINPKPSMIGI